jgi:N-acetylglutamate synthase-like GNAT family acetyltransferase
MAPRTPLSEKEFYLHAFKHRSILFHLADGLRLVEVAAVVERLVANSTMVVVSGGPRAGLGRGAYRKLDPAGGPALVALSRELVDKGRAAVVADNQASGVPRLRFSVALATTLGISKLVLVDPRGGLSRAGERMSFVTTARLARLSPPGPWTARELDLCRRALAVGVSSVNLTGPEGLERELLTYEGSGTLLTQGPYCRVAKLGIDDFDQALALLGRGEQDGVLLRRSKAERAELLLSAYGAWFEDHRLAGLASLDLDSYRSRRLAEVVGLYSITRFKGQGVGKRILDRLVEVARAGRRRALFACTSSGEAAAFFQRNGFELAGPERVPVAKWKGRRHARPSTVLWRRL